MAQINLFPYQYLLDEEMYAPYCPTCKGHKILPHGNNGQLRCEECGRIGYAGAMGNEATSTFSQVYQNAIDEDSGIDGDEIFE